MKCHVLSGSACARHISSSPFGHEVVVSGRGSGYSVRFPRLRVFGMGLSSRSLFVPFGAAAGLSAERPFSARIACARLSRRRAFCAPDCAREAGARRTSPVGFSGVFRAGAKQETKRCRECRFLLPHLSTELQESSRIQELFQILMDKCAMPTMPRPCRSADSCRPPTLPGTEKAVPEAASSSCMSWLLPCQVPGAVSAGAAPAHSFRARGRSGSGTPCRARGNSRAPNARCARRSVPCGRAGRVQPRAGSPHPAPGDRRNRSPHPRQTQSRPASAASNTR